MTISNPHMQQQDVFNEYAYFISIYTEKMSKALEFKNWSILLAISTAIATIGIYVITASSFLIAQEFMIFQEGVLFLYIICIIYFDGKYSEYNYTAQRQRLHFLLNDV